MDTYHRLVHYESTEGKEFREFVIPVTHNNLRGFGVRCDGVWGRKLVYVDLRDNDASEQPQTASRQDMGEAIRPREANRGKGTRTRSSFRT